MLVVLLLSVLQEVTRYAELAKGAGHLISKAQYVIRYEPRLLSQCATNTRCDPDFVNLCPLLFACFFSAPARAKDLDVHRAWRRGPHPRWRQGLDAVTALLACRRQRLGFQGGVEEGATICKHIATIAAVEIT